jgi:hypothetical protein
MYRTDSEDRHVNKNNKGHPTGAPSFHCHTHRLPIVIVSRGRPLIVASMSEIALTTSNHSFVSPFRMLAKPLSSIIASLPTPVLEHKSWQNRH